MQKTYIYLLTVLTGTIILCGCNKQAKLNSQKIDILSQKIVKLEQDQDRQIEVLQSELIQLAPELNKMNSTYFEKNRDESLFFHTNTLYLLLTIGKQIETQLQTADTERETENALAYSYHTNQLGTMYLCTAQAEEAMNDQQKAIVDEVNAETRQVNANSTDALLNQIKASAAPDPAEVARRKQMEAEMAQMQQDLEAIKARLGITNQPVAQP